MIARYTSGAFGMYKRDDGNMVYYSDHIRDKDTALAKLAKAEAELAGKNKWLVPISKDGLSVFIDGPGMVDLDWDRRIEKLEAKLAKAREALKAAKSWIEDNVRERDSEWFAVLGELATVLSEIEEPHNG